LLTARINLFTLALLSAAILMLAFWIPMTSVPQLIAFSVLYGFPAGIFISLTSACVAQISPPHMIGTRLGLLTAGAAVFALAGGPISGALIAQFEQGYRWAGLFSGSVLVIGAAFAAAARLVIQRRVMVVV
jgi:MFS family permease